MASRNKNRPPKCLNFQQGFCRYGDDCAFRHPGPSDLRSRIQGRQGSRIQGRQVTVESEPRHGGSPARKGNSPHARWQAKVQSHLIQVGDIDIVEHVATSVPLPPHMKLQGTYTHWLRKMGFIIVNSGGSSLQVRLQQGHGRKRAAPGEEPHRPVQRRREEAGTLSAMYATDDASSDEVPAHGEVTLEEVMAQVAAVMYSWGHLM